MAAMVAQVHPEGHGSGCGTCGCKFKRFSHRKSSCQRCGDAVCTRCIMKSPKKVTQGMPEIKKSMCQSCNALIVVPFMNDRALQNASAPQLTRYLDHHDVVHAHLTRTELENVVFETRRERGRPDRATIQGQLASPTQASRNPRAEQRSGSRHNPPARSQSGSRRDPTTAAGASSGAAGANRPHPSITNLLLAEHLLGQLLMAIDGTAAGPQQSDEEYQAQQREMRDKHQKQMERQRIASKLQTAKSEDVFREMRVADLKIILEFNNIDHSTVIEKEELLAKVIELWQTTQVIENMTNTDRTCKICMDAPSDCVFLECGHLVTCVTCGEQLEECPMCRSQIVRAIRVYET